MIFIDTGFLVAFTDPQDNLHGRATRWAKYVQSAPLLITNYILIETYGFFTHPASRQRGDRTIQAVLDQPEVELVMVGAGLHEAGLALFRNRPDKHWSLTDCVSFALMERGAVQRALAYDHHFEQAGFEPLLRRAPD